MAFGDRTLVGQSAGSSTSPSHSFGGTATSGRLLVAGLIVDDGVDLTAIPTGWSEAVHADNTVVGTYQLYKISDGTETSISGTLASSQEWTILFAQYEGPFDATPLDVTTSNYESSNQSTGSTGTTGTTAQNDELAVAIMGCQDGDAQDGTPGSAADSWTNSFADVTSHRQGSAVGDAGAYMGYRVLTATGTVETTCDWNNTNSRSHNTVATYKKGAAGGADQEPALIGGKLTNSLLLEHLVR